MDRPEAASPALRCASLNTPREAPRAVRILCMFAFGVIGLALAYTGGTYIYHGEPDFEYFYKAGAALLEHGSLDAGYERLPTPADGAHHKVHWYWPYSDQPSGPVFTRGKLDWYWPFVHRSMTLLAWMPYWPAGSVWLGLNLLALLTTLRLVGTHLTGLPARDWPVTLLLPFLFLGVFWHWEFHLNQIDIVTMLLLVAAFVHWQQRRTAIAGVWLGLAVLIKITPLLMLVWFALKRQYRTVAVALLTIVIAGPASDVVAFGPSKTVDHYRAWLNNAVSAGSHRALVLAQREMDWRNQGIGAVLSRWLHPTNYNTHFDNEPRANSNYEPRTLNVVDLPLETIATIASAVLGLSLLGLLWLARRPAKALTPWQLRFEWALFLLAMLWFMPVMRRYHMIWVFPSLAMFGGALHHLGLRRAWSVLALLSIGLVVAGQIALPSKVLIGANMLEARGMLLGMVALIGLPIILLLLMMARDPSCMPLTGDPSRLSAQPPPRIPPRAAPDGPHA